MSADGAGVAPEEPEALSRWLRQPLDGASVSVPLQRCRLDGSATFERPCNVISGFECVGELFMGAFTYTFSHISVNVAHVGRYCSIAPGVSFGHAEHAVDWLSTSSFAYEPHFMNDEQHERLHRSVFAPHPLPGEKKRGRIHIGHDVWIGANAYIRSGVTLGDACIVGANAVVTKDVPPYAVVVGNPGRIARFRFAPELVQRLQELAWWRIDYTNFSDLDVTRPQEAADRLERLIEDGLQPYAPPPVRLLGDGARIKLADA